MYLSEAPHWNFGHFFIEELFALYWSIAEHQGTWAVDPAAVLLFFSPARDADGRPSKLARENNRPQTGGGAGQRHRHVLLHALSRLHGMFTLAEDMASLGLGDRILRFPRVVVDGLGGRSPWDGRVYPDRKALPLAFGEFTHGYKTAAYGHFARYTGRLALVCSMAHSGRLV